MKVLMLSTSYPRRKGDYAGNFIHELASALAADGVGVSVAAPADKGGGSFQVMDGVSVERFRYFWPSHLQGICYGGSIISNMRANPLLWLELPFFVLSYFYTALRLSAESDIIHAHWVLSGALAVAVKKVTGKPVVLTVHGSDLNARPGNRLASMAYSWIFNSSDLVIAVSNKLRDGILPLVKDRSKVLVVRNCVDLSKFKPEEKGRKDEGKTILFVGRLTRDKGVGYLVEAFGAVVGAHPDAKLVLAGDGPMKAELVKMAEEAGLESKVEFLGFVSHDMLPDLYRNAAVLVLPSLSEGFPLSLVEAMSCGLPAVATRVGGVPEAIVEGETGLLVEPGDVRGLSEALRRVLADGALRRRMSEAARGRVVSEFALSLAADRMVKAYDRVIKEAGP